MIRNIVFRLVAIAIGIAVTLLVVEGVLQIASRFVQRTDRAVGVAPIEGELRITCIGESTTYGLWPSQLEEILNDGRTQRSVRVINRGAVGIRTDSVARRIEGWLDEDQPHLVVTMLGINDEGNVLVYPRGDAQRWLIEHSKTARLIDLLWRSARNIGFPGTSGDGIPGADDHLDDATRSKLAMLEDLRSDTMKRFRIKEMIGIHLELIVTDPGTPFYHLSYLRQLVLNHEPKERLVEFFINEAGVDPEKLNDEQRSAEISIWAERTGDGFAALRVAASIAYARNDNEGEQRILEAAVEDPEIAGLAWLRLADFSSRAYRPDVTRQSLLNADRVLPDDYQWLLLLGDISFMLEEYDLAAGYFQRALSLRSDLPASHELLWLGRLANACEQSGDLTRAAACRAQRDELELDRFREFTRFNYQRIVDILRERDIPVIAMQYPLLSVESLKKLLDYRDDVTYLENRTDFEAALLERRYRELFNDNFAGSFGHLSPLGNEMVAKNVADTLTVLIPELALVEYEPQEGEKQYP
jgi:tetratricopeptide (TPR) repeat protein